MNFEIDFISGDTKKCLLAVSLPMLAAMFLNMAYNLVDSLWIGNLMGETAYAALTGAEIPVIDPAKTARYRKGFRSGQGDALAVVFPGSLLELWRVLKACVAADKIILMQAANTGLTEGSTPNGNDYDRDVVIISTLRLDKLHILGKGEQVLAYPGTTLY